MEEQCQENYHFFILKINHRSVQKVWNGMLQENGKCKNVSPWTDNAEKTALFCFEDQAQGFPRNLHNAMSKKIVNVPVGQKTAGK